MGSKGPRSRGAIVLVYSLSRVKINRAHGVLRFSSVVKRSVVASLVSP